MRQLLNETMKINEEDIGDLPVDQPDKVAITPELIASLVEELPELADVDQSELEAGLEVEQEHMETVGGEMLTVAKIVLDHIKEFPGKKYYQALAAMEDELREAPEEGEVETLPAEEEGEVLASETPTEETPMESKKEQIGSKKTKIDERKRKKQAPVQEQTPAPAKVETATNEEAQKMVDSGEATIPPEAVIKDQEEKKE